jgi:hypothetical protein
MTYIKYFLRKVNDNDEIKQVIIPSREEWEISRGYGLCKINLDYGKFVTQYVKREDTRLKVISTCSITIDKVVVDEENKQAIISEIESREDFIRWEN